MGRPGAVAAALAAYRETATGGPVAAAEELARVESGLRALEARQQAAVTAQIAGITAGAAPNAYDAVFAELAKQRVALEGRRAELARPPRRQQAAGQTAGGRDWAAILTDARRVLGSPDVSGEDKRNLLSTVVDRVYPRPDGARVVFQPEAPGAGAASAVNSAGVSQTLQFVPTQT